MAKVEKDINVSEIIKRRKYDVAVKQGYIDLLGKIIFFIIAGWFLFTQVFMLMRNTGIDMFPSIKDGDLILVYRLEKDYERDDVVIYEVDGTLHVGRIIADEYDVISITSDGYYEVNNMSPNSEILFPTYPKENTTITYPLKVPTGEVFILGDYRTKAADSRDFGSVPIKDIKGKIITILRRRGI